MASYFCVWSINQMLSDLHKLWIIVTYWMSIWTCPNLLLQLRLWLDVCIIMHWSIGHSLESFTLKLSKPKKGKNFCHRFNVCDNFGSFIDGCALFNFILLFKILLTLVYFSGSARCQCGSNSVEERASISAHPQFSRWRRPFWKPWSHCSDSSHSC